MQAVSDEQLIRWVAEGDTSCVGTLFERYHTGVYRYCLQITKQKELSEDLVQEVFLKVIHKAKSYRGDGCFKAWLFNLARNITFDSFKYAKHRNSPSQQSDDSGPSAEQTASDAQSLDLVSRALAGLPDKVREVIWLGRFEFEDYSDLAVALDCNVGTARVRMHRAMQQLHTAFEKLQGGTP